MAADISNSVWDFDGIKNRVRQITEGIKKGKK